VAAETSLRSRLVYASLLIGSLCMTTVVAALLLSEAGLPTRTRLAFSALVGIGLAWSGLFAWILARRRVLFAQHRVIAGRLAVVVTSFFVAGSLTLAALVPEQARIGLTAAGLGSILVAIALGVLWRAARRRGELLARRAQLEA
jgi:hypothetical protein